MQVTYQLLESPIRLIAFMMDYPTLQHNYAYSQDNIYGRGYTPSSPAPRLDGLPASSEEPVLVQSKESTKTENIEKDGEFIFIIIFSFLLFILLSNNFIVFF